jgi:hypothetical protein
MERLGGRVGRGDGTGLEGDYDCVRVNDLRLRGDVDGLDNSHAGADEVVRQVRGSGKVIGNATQEGHDPSSFDHFASPQKTAAIELTYAL